jgi:hypothetical protein
MIRLDNDLFKFVSPSAGLGTNRYVVPLQRTTERKVECRTGGDCPEAIPEETKAFGGWRLSFAESPSSNTPNSVVTWTNDLLKIVFTRNRREDYPAPFTGHSETTETLNVDLVRGTAP